MTHLPLPGDFLATLPATPGAYLVGGTVRDLLMKRRPTDIDIVVEGSAAAFARTLAERVGARVVPMGKADLTTYRVTSRQVLIDVTAVTGPSLENDLRRRDFTVNAMACRLHDHRLVDIMGGRRDIETRRIRMVSEKAFVHDPLRLLRAFRMAAVLDFTIEPDTLAAIQRHGHRIHQPAGERLGTEFVRLLTCPSSTGQILAMSASGLLTHLIPEMQPMRDCRQNRHHDFDVYTHTLEAFAALETCLQTADRISAALGRRYRQAPYRRKTPAILKYAILLHDIGKPPTRQTDAEGDVHFYGHAQRSTELAEAVHARLRFSNEEAAQARAIILNHDRPMNLLTAHKAQTLRPKGINRLYRDCDPWTPEVLLHALGDTMGKKRTPDSAVATTLHFIRSLIDDYFHRYRPLAQGRPLVGGRDLMHHFDLQPSPLVGELLQAIEEERLAGRITTRADAMAHAAACLARISRPAAPPDDR
jgi:tRNA nucleotidyltransferase/poly(A) polymerase